MFNACNIQSFVALQRSVGLWVTSENGFKVSMVNLDRLFSWYLQHCWLIIQAPVVGKVDNAFNSGKIYPVDNEIGFL